MRRFVGMLLALLMLLPAGVRPGRCEESEAQLTLFVYITGSNLESEAGAATRDIAEMLRSGVDTGRVNILLMTGGSRKWWGGFPNDQLCVYRAVGARPELLWQTDMASMGESDTLSQFLNYGCENYPARQYALILWDHGGGPLEGVCFDELHNSDRLSLAELRAALEASPFGGENPLEWIGFDACLMSCVETAHVCAPYARYMIASQETEPGTGWDYGFLGKLGDGADGAQVGRSIVDSYFESADEQTRESLTLACVDLSKIDAVERAMDAMFGELDAIISPESFSMLSNGRRDAKNFGRLTTGSEYDLVDLHHLAQLYAPVAPESAAALQAALEEAVVYQRSGPEDGHGLSVYYPYYNKERYRDIWDQTYSELNFSDGYIRYLGDYAGLWLGEALADWEGLGAVGMTPEAGGQELTMALSPEQAAHFASAELYILEEVGGNNAYFDIYHTDDVQLEADTLRSRYEYRSLYAVDGDGNPLTNALTYIKRGDTYFVRTALSNLSANADLVAWAASAAEGGVATVLLQCRQAPGSDELQITGVIEVPDYPALKPMVSPAEEDMLLSGKQTLSLDDWPWIQFLRFPRVRVDASPCIQWPFFWEEHSGSIYMDITSVDNRTPWKLKFCPEQYGGRNLYAQYVVRDTQGDYFASELLPIANPNTSENLAEEIPLIEEPELTITLTSIATVQSPVDAGLYLRLHVDSRAATGVDLKLESIAFDSTMVAHEIPSYNYGDWVSGAYDVVFIIPASGFPPLASDALDSLSFDLCVGERKFPVRVEQRIELGSLCAPLLEPSAPLSRARVGEIDYELMELRESEGGALEAVIRVVNGGAERAELYLSGACDINGCCFEDNCSGGELVLQPGCDAYCQLEINCLTPHPPGDYWFVESDFDVVNGFDYWGISAVEALGLRLYNSKVGEKIDFTLDEPLPLRVSRQAPEEAPLLSEDGLSLSLRGTAIEDDALCLELALRNGANVEVELALDEARADGSGVEASMYTERSSQYFSAPIPAKYAQRARIEIPLSGNDAPERLELSFRFRPVGDDPTWQYCSAATLEFSPGEAEAASVVPGRKLENPAIDPCTLFAPEVEMPANAEQFAATLSVQLTPEQASAVDSAALLLVEPIEDGAYRLRSLVAGLKPDADGRVSANVCGLLPGIVGQRGTIVLRRSGESRELELVSLSFKADDYKLPSLNFNRIVLSPDDGGGMRVSRAQVDRDARALDHFAYVQFYYIDRVPAFNEDGSLAHYDDWPACEMFVGESAETDGSPVRLEMKPADTSKICVLLTVYNQDGTGYTLPPIPYAEAVESPD